MTRKRSNVPTKYGRGWQGKVSISNINNIIIVSRMISIDNSTNKIIDGERGLFSFSTIFHKHYNGYIDLL